MTDHILSSAIDDYYEPKILECFHCKDDFFDDTVYESKHDKEFVFCSEWCRDEFDSNRDQEEVA